MCDTYWENGLLYFGERNSFLTTNTQPLVISNDNREIDFIFKKEKHVIEKVHKLSTVKKKKNRPDHSNKKPLRRPRKKKS